MKRISVSLAVFLFGIVLYLNTLPNRYAYDDHSVVEGNRFTRQGIAGIPGHLIHDSFTGFTGQENLFRGGRYRPLSLVTFSIEYQFFGSEPRVSHLINVLIYGLTCLLLFRLLTALLREKNDFRRFRDYFLSLSLVGSLLFAAHPVHTEVVANIKGRDELMALLFGLLAWHALVRYADTLRLRYALQGGIYFFLALLSKESAAALLVLIPISLYCFRETSVCRKSLSGSVLPLLLGFLLFFLLRQSVLGWSASPTAADNILSNAFMFADGASERYGTIFLTLGLYLKLLVWPHPLTIDYYPFHIPYVGMDDLRAIVPLAGYTVLAGIAVWLTRRKSPAGFGLLFYLVALFPVSNLPFIIGPFMGERFLFLPSVGFTLLLARLIQVAATRFRLQRAVPPLVVVILLGYSVRTIARNFDWKDNFTLYTHDAGVSANSAVINKGAGHQYLLKAEAETDPEIRKSYAAQAIPYLEKAYRLNRTETEIFLLGNAFYEQGDLDWSLDLFLETLQMNKSFEKAYVNFLIAANRLTSPRDKIHSLDRLERVAGKRYETYYHKGLIYGKELSMPDSALASLLRAYQADSTRTECLGDLGVALGMKGDFHRSAYFLEKAYRLTPGDERIRRNLAATYMKMGFPEKAKAVSGGR